MRKNKHSLKNEVLIFAITILAFIAILSMVVFVECVWKV